MALASGTRLGPYEIVDLLGAGGMGEVYRARDARLRRDVAVKVLHPGRDGDGHRLLREARVVSTLTDPHIVAVHDVGEAGGAVFVAMELVDGVPLTRRVVRGGLPIEDLLRLAIDIAAGLACAHAAGVVHRDLKPANVMVTRGGVAKILDFGLATRASGDAVDTTTLESLAGPGVVAGTVAYMSPEQAEGRPVDARSDVFAFGVVIYELATGSRPFDRESAAGTLAAILRDPGEPLSVRRPDVPMALARIVERCLRKDPARRVQSMADLKVALEDLRDDLSKMPAALPTTSSPPARRWTAIAKAIGLAAAGAAAALAIPLSRPAVPPPLTGTDLTQLTFDGGISGSPALSTDGSLLAFASDRAGNANLDIWVQPVAGGEPIQVTRDPVDERTPVFSPDGGRIVFRSERDGGGIYSVPALGGEPRLLVAGGLSPRLSPDGRQMAYWTGSFIGFSQSPGMYRTFVVDAAGGTPREIEGFTNVRNPIWSPDGRSLIVSATKADAPEVDTYDWWMVRLDADPPVALGARQLLGGATSDLEVRAPSAWISNHVLTSWRGDLWAVALTGTGPKATAVERLTFGPGSEVDPVATAGGMVAFADAVSRVSIWSLPIDSDHARPFGDFRRITAGTGPFSRATMSADERWAAFYGRDRSATTIQVQDLSTGRIRDLVATPGATFGPVISPDGQFVAYPAKDSEIHVMAVKGGAPAVVCRGCQEAGDWTRDGRGVTVVTNPGGVTGLGLADVASGAVTAVASSGDERSLNRPTLSPDNRWIAFRGMSTSQQLFVSAFAAGRPIPRDSWEPVGDPERDVRPVGWSPNGGILYLFSSRDGFRCLYAQRMDRTTGRPIGAATLVKHAHNIRGAGGGGGSVISSGAGNPVGRQQILFDFPDQLVNVWTMRLGLQTPGPSSLAPAATP
jgi:serine/threonine protein kinase